MKKGKKIPAPTIVNRRARYDYELGEEFRAGLVLSGPEVRAIRDHRAQLKGAFVSFRDGELWLNNASLSVRPTSKESVAVDSSPRKLLVTRKELDKLSTAKQDGLTIVPTKLLTTGRYIKVIIALARGKKRYDKRQAIKQRDQEREARVKL